MAPNILAFNCSNLISSVALSQGDKIIAFEQNLEPSMQAETLLPLIESTLKKGNLKYQDLNYISVINGPGSFTGIRIGLSTASGLVAALPKLKPIIVSNFEMAWYRAQSQIHSYDKIIVILNAYRGEFYVQEFDNKGNKLEAKLISKTTLIEIMNAKNDGISFYTGSGIELIYSDIKHLALNILPRHKQIKAYHICLYTNEFISSGLISSLQPLYIRPVDAKVSTSS